MNECNNVAPFVSFLFVGFGYAKYVVKHQFDSRTLHSDFHREYWGLPTIFAQITEKKQKKIDVSKKDLSQIDFQSGITNVHLKTF